MHLKYKDIIDLTASGPAPCAALSKLVTAQFRTGAIPLGKLLCDMGQTLKSFKSHIAEFQEAHKKLIAAFDTDSEGWRDDQEKLVAFEAEFAVLLENEIDLHLTPQPEAILDQAVSLEFSAMDIERVAWFFQRAEAEQAKAAGV